MVGNYQGMVLMLMNFLRIPPGIQVRKSYGVSKDASTNWYEKTLASHDFINTMVDITADDVCIGSSPLYLENADMVVSPELKKEYLNLVKSLNKISRWIAVDLLKRGISVYILKKAVVTIPKYVDGQQLEEEVIIPNLVPVLDDVEVYMTEEGEIVYIIDGKVRNDLLVFLNYSRETIILNRKDGDHVNPNDNTSRYKFQITPEPIQLKHVQSVATDLYMVERAMYRYRIQLSKIARFAEVEVGVSQGGNNNETVVDNASAAVNANSMSLGMTAADPVMNFDDNLPIVPVRKGIGHIEVTSDIPDFDKIKELPDLDYTLNRLFLAMRFPKSYADFNQALNDTAVSLIRGDIRYSRMVEYTRSVIQDSINRWMFGIKFDATEWKYQVKLTSLPNSEDDDVVEALTNYQQFVDSVFEFISAAEGRLDANARLNSIVILLGDTANINAIQKWVVQMREYIDNKFGDGSLEDTQEEIESEETPVEGEEVFDLDSETTPPSSSGESTVETAQEPPENFDLPPTAE